MDKDLKEALELSIDMWTWLVEHPDKRKRDYMEIKKAENPEYLIPVFCCHICSYALFHSTKKCPCVECPIKWSNLPYKYGKDEPPCMYEDSPFFRWEDGYYPEACKVAAEEVLNLLKAKLYEVTNNV